MNKKNILYIVIPCYNEEAVIRETAKQVAMKMQQLYEKARHNKSWKNPDGIPSSDGGAKKSMQTIVSKGKRFEREKENFTDTTQIFTDSAICL